MHDPVALELNAASEVTRGRTQVPPALLSESPSAVTDAQHRDRAVRYRIIGAVTVAMASTLLVVLVPNLRFAYENATLKIACETTAALGAGLASFLVVGRSRSGRRLDDELLSYGLGLLALADFLLVLLPSEAAPHTTALRVITWVPLGCQFVAGASLALASAPATSMRRLARWGWSVAAGVVPLAVIVVLPLLVGLPSDTARSIPLASAANPQLQREPLVAGVQLAIAALLACACVGFTRRAEREGDRFALWLAAGCGLTAVARLNFALFPSLFSQWLYTGDVIRLAGYGCWLIGSTVEIASYWRSLAASAIADERRRLARELHDGLAQELAFLTAEIRSWAPAQRHFVAASAAERALEESRRAIAALSGSDVPFDESLRRTVEEIALRHGARATVVTDVGSPLAAESAEHVLRIAREATVNACRHGGATAIRVSLTGTTGDYCLQIVDNGCGFDPGSSAPMGFGLHFMRDRADLLGGTIAIAIRPEGGVRVKVYWQ